METANMTNRQPKAMHPNEKFFQYFTHEVTDIREQMERLEQRSVSGGERADAVDHCLASIARLSNEVKDASSHLPAYDQRTYGTAVKALSDQLQNIRSTFAPRPKFSFKSGSMFTARKNESAISLTDAAEPTNERQGPAEMSTDSSYVNSPAEPRSPTIEAEGERPIADAVDLARIRQPSFSQATTINMGDHDGVHIILPSSAAHATSSGTLSMLRRCIVDMSRPTTTGQPLAGLTVKNVKQSLVVCGHVNGAAHLTNISNSVIVVASRQFRMHESRNCDIYLFTSSRPIIEDCQNIRFAPLPETYKAHEHEGVENQWQNVDDFKWLKNEHSPHWNILDEAERIPESVWTGVVPGGPQHGTEDILRAVGVAQ
ncbi:uncharacterized protein LTR77_002842 [Saxophila tyrrhenica]|uniref:C-CAP/cofactor C-like domain-containing protein n=1 Tax=Saxophila tyrrhenica TaxID=1690608 RepID=A0AAV9PG76_9PEZI|nr:hypothetical protein LTR77_002842 [Saxophila tyrrhenica]